MTAPNDDHKPSFDPTLADVPEALATCEAQTDVSGSVESDTGTSMICPDHTGACRQSSPGQGM